MNRLRASEAIERKNQIAEALHRAAEEFEEKLRKQNEEHTKELAGAN